MHGGQIHAVGLGNVEDVGIAEIQARTRGSFCLVMSFLGFLVLLAFHAHHRREDADSLGFSGVDVAAKVLPCVQKPATRVAVGLCRGNLQHVAEAVSVKAAHGREVVGEGVGVSGLQLLDQQLDVGGDELLAVCLAAVVWASCCRWR